MKIINTLTNLNFSDNNNLNDYWNNELIQKLYFIPKKIDINLIYSRLKDEAYKEQLSNTIKYLNTINIEDEIEKLLEYFENNTRYSLKDEKIYVIIGLNTTTIYSTIINNEEITVLCIESINGIYDKLKILIAHEFTHFVRKNLLNKDIFESSIGERLVTEGIAINYSREMVPNKEESQYCIVSSNTIEWVKENIQFIEKYTKEELDNNNLMLDLFYMFAKIDFPVRSGYVYGYLKVKAYLEKNKLKVKDILGINWQDILKK